ncbi:hypothetical protein [Burkholderia stagnalis]|uniref:hypothetical protein n=1 Tax=Burkholderia stagnalis TaxID=1503054 RepID=UPI0012DADED5|nr:hypothetical protein [Burkholderia stagnalis]
MKRSLKIFVDAAKETPALYFAPVVGALKAASKVTDEMATTKGVTSKGMAPFTVDKARHHRKPR